MGQVLYKVFKKPKYLVGAIGIAMLVFTFATWLPNISLLANILFDGSISFSGKLSFLFSLILSIKTNFTFVSRTYTILIAVLFGINVMLLVYYIHSVKSALGEVKTSGAIGIGGLISGIFGIGCAACGTFVLTSFLALFGATSVLSILPFGGEEFGFLGVGLLLLSIYKLLKKISSPLVCNV